MDPFVRYAAINGPAAPDGQLVTAKPVVTSSEPMDLRNYHSTNPAFRHESAGDQFFSESQLESYRALGWHAADTICGGPTATFKTIEQFIAQVTTYTGDLTAAAALSTVNKVLAQSGNGEAASTGTVG